MLQSIASLGIMGAAFGALLAFASKKFAVETDPKVEAIINALPGANCGACGYPGCAGLAVAIAAGKMPVEACPVGGARVAAAVGQIMGQTVSSEGVVKVAALMCSGDCDQRGQYTGIETCRAANLLGGGTESCAYGCLGFADCVRVCPFDAIAMNEKGIPVIDEDKCQNCGKCVKECPKQLFIVVPKDSAVHVNCSSQDTGVDTRKTGCATGCIACGICEKTCPFGAIHIVKDPDNDPWPNPRKLKNVAVNDYDKCRSCGLCVSKCPTKALILEENKKHKKPVIGEGCIGCTICARNCPVNAIDGELKQIHHIDHNKCIACHLCVDKCPKKVISY